MMLHCVYCGEAIPVTRIRFGAAPEDEQARRLAFEEKHDAQCGPKSVAMIMDFEPAPERA